MKIIKPCFYDEFECIADKCTFTCCKFWRIDIDEETYEKYMEIEGSLGEKLKKSVMKNDENNIRIIRLDEKGNCPLQDENGLCEIVKEKGSEYLSNVCKFYPRSVLGYADTIERSMYPSCPAVVEFFYDYEYLTFVEEDNGIDAGRVFDDIDEQAMFDADLSNIFISMIQVPEVPLWVKQYLVLRLADSIKEPYLKKDYEAVAAVTARYTDISVFSKYSIGILKMSFEDTDVKYDVFEKMRRLFFDRDLSEIFSEADDDELESMDYSRLREIEPEFNSKVYRKIEYVIENLCVNEIYSNVKRSLGEYYIYENLVIIFIHASMIKHCMFMYWLKNGKEITKDEEIRIIAATSRSFYHNEKKVKNFCVENKELIRPEGMFHLLRE